MKKRICSLLLICSMLAGLLPQIVLPQAAAADTAAARDGFGLPTEEKTGITDAATLRNNPYGTLGWVPLFQNHELVVPDPDDITFLEAEKFASRVDYGGYTVPLAFLGRHAAGSAAIAVELALALCKKGYDIPDEAILEGLAAVENRSSIRVLSQRPLVVLDACRTPQQAIALLRVLNMAKVRHLSAVIGLAEEEGAEAFFSALESGLTAETQKKDRTTMPGMSENPFDKVFLVPPAGTDAAMTERLLEKARYHFDVELCGSLAEAVNLARANSRRGLLICGGEAIALEAADLLAEK